MRVATLKLRPEATMHELACRPKRLPPPTGLVRMLAIVASTFLASCDSVPHDAVTRCEQIQLLPSAAKTDILFVVDDSPSMDRIQENLKSNFQAFVDRLAQSPVKDNFQIGITTTSVDRLDTTTRTFVDTFAATTADCPSPAAAGDTYPAGAIVRVTGTTDPCSRRQFTTGTPRILAADSPTLVSDFAEDAFVGVVGSGKEQGLEAARRALSEPLLSGANAGFLRSGSRLAVIIVSDDDDCSDPVQQGTTNEPPTCTSYDVQNYVNFFKGPIGGETRDMVLGAIVAVDPVTLQPSACIEPSGNPAEHAATRYKAFTDAFTNTLTDSVCNASFHDTLVKIAGLIDPAQTLALSGAPPDFHMLSVTVRRTGVAQPIACKVGIAGGAPADVVYSPPSGSLPPQLSFGGTCTLQQGDQVDVKVLCAG